MELFQTSLSFLYASSAAEALCLKATSKDLLGTLLDLCVSSLRRRHANLLCIVPILSEDS